MTRTELQELIHSRYNLLEDGEGDAPAAGGDTAAPVATSTSNITSDASSSSTGTSSTSSSDSYSKDDIMFGDDSGSMDHSSNEFGGVASGGGDFAPLDNPFIDRDDEPSTEPQQPDKYEVLGFLEKDPDYPDEKDYIKVRNIDTKEVKILPLSQIDLA